MESLEFSVQITTASPPSLTNDLVCLQKETLYILTDVETWTPWPAYSESDSRR